MGPIIPALVSQFRPSLPYTNPNIRKGDSTKGRGPHPRKGSGQPPWGYCDIPSLTTSCTKPTNSASLAPVTVREDTPWPGTGKMLGNPFEERNWVLPKDYLAIEDKKEDATVAKPPLREEESKTGEQTSSQKEEKCGWGPNCPFCKALKKDGEDQQQKPLPKLQAKRPDTLNMTKMRQQ